MSAAMIATTTSGAYDAPPAGLKNLSLAYFDFMPAHLRPSRVDDTPHRTSPRQQAAWRRLCAWIVEETTRRAIEARKAVGVERGVWAEPDPCQGGADEQARDGGESGSEDGDDGDTAPPRFTA